MTRKGVDLLGPIMRALGGDYVLNYTGGQNRQIAKQTLPNNMHDIGRLRNKHKVIEAMHNADALLFPSRSEGFGLVAAEALACGLPVVATHSSSLREVIEDGVTGALCQQDNVNAFAGAIENMAKNPELWRTMSKAGIRIASDRYCADRMISDYIACYQALYER